MRRRHEPTAAPLQRRGLRQSGRGTGGRRRNPRGRKHRPPGQPAPPSPLAGTPRPPSRRRPALLPDEGHDRPPPATSPPPPTSSPRATSTRLVYTPTPDKASASLGSAATNIEATDLLSVLRDCTGLAEGRPRAGRRLDRCDRLRLHRSLFSSEPHRCPGHWRHDEWLHLEPRSQRKSPGTTTQREDSGRSRVRRDLSVERWPTHPPQTRRHGVGSGRHRL